MKRQGRYHFRYILPALIFIIICLGFMGRIIYMQMTTPEIKQEAPVYTKTLTVKAVRGEIFDRNGKKLVANQYTYSVYLDGGSLAKGNTAFNQTALKLTEILGESIDLPYFPITNTYLVPQYKEFADGSPQHNSFMKMLDNWQLPRNSSAKDVLDFICQRYGIISQKGKLTIPEKDVISVAALRYEAERMNFSVLNPFTVASNITAKHLTAIEEAGLKGVEISKNASRVYYYPGYASHILGRTGKIQSEELEYYTEKGYSMDAIVGVDGVEKAFEEYLRGVDGTLVIVEDENGNIIDEYYKKEPVAGNDVYLTLDISLQIAAEDALKYNVLYIKDKATAKINEKTLEYTDADGNLLPNADIPQYIGEDVSSGAATLVNPKNGEIYALASYPTFDLTYFSRDYNTLANAENQPLFNRALQGTYEPGSTFKISMAAAALEYGIINKNTTIFDSGVYKYYRDFQPECWIYTSYKYGHGNVNVISAIQHSCNYFFYDVGRQLTIERMNEYCKTLGLGEATGIELPESKGILAGPEYRASVNKLWVPGDTVQAAIGQSDNTFTPLQISMYLSSIINGGSRYKAHLLHSVRKFGTNEIIFAESPTVLNTVQLSAENLQTLKTGMKNVMENGTAAPVFSKYPVELGGKTGTAQVGTSKSNNGIFMAFAPYDDPEIVASCIIEQAGESNDVGITIRKMFNQYFNISE